MRKNLFPWTSAAARRLRAMAAEPVAPMHRVVEKVVANVLGETPAVPTNLEDLAARFGVVSINPEDIFYSGELRRVEGGLQIIYSSHQSSVRSRFTIAHELAHALFYSTGPNPPRTGKELERLCDMLAVEFLMPRNAFWPEFVRRGASASTVMELASMFKTSLSSTAIRCTELVESILSGRLIAFELTGDQVSWGSGGVRRGPVRSLERCLREVAARSATEASGTEDVWLSTGFSRTEWMVDWARLRAAERTLFVAVPTREVGCFASAPRPLRTMA